MRGRRCSAASTMLSTSSTLSVTIRHSASAAAMFPFRRDLGEQPVDQPAPVGRAEQHDREVADLAGLAQRRGLEQLVQRAEAAREDDERARVAHEHHLAREEVVEVEADVDVVVLELLVRQLDVEPDRRHAGVARAAVAGLHDAGAAAGDDREARPAQHRGRLARLGVHRVVARRARRAEDRDGLADVREAAKPARSSSSIRCVRALSSSSRRSRATRPRAAPRRTRSARADGCGGTPPRRRRST